MTIGTPGAVVAGTASARDVRDRYFAAGAFALAVLCYLNAVHGAFVFDDIKLIVNNDIIKDPRHAFQVLSTNLWGLLGRESNYYRPLPPLLFLVLHALFGMKPEPFHVVNILLHAGTTCLVFLTARTLLVRTGTPEGPARWAAFAGAAVFAVHPIHAEAVAWISGVMDVACTFFSLLAIYLYVTADASNRRVARECGSALALLLALFSKEPAAITPFLLVASDLLFCRDRVRAVASALRRWGPPFAVLAFYLCLRGVVLGGIAPIARDQAVAWTDVALTLPRWLALYLQKLVIPMPLNVLHDVRPVASAASPEFLWSLAIIAASAAIAFLAWRAGQVAVFGLILFVGALAPALYVPALGQDLSLVFAERYLYFPSVGAAFLLSAALSVPWPGNKRIHSVVGAAVTVVVIVFCGMTIARNRVWADSVTLWSDCVQKSPNLGIAREALGLALIRSGQFEQGARELQVALRLQPELAEKSMNFGVFAARKGLLLQAVLSFQTALLYDANYVDAHFNLAIAYERMGWNSAAIQEYTATLASDPAHADAHNNLGILLAQSFRMDEAIEHFEAAVRSRPRDADFRLNLAKAFEAKGMGREAGEQRALAALARSKISR